MDEGRVLSAQRLRSAIAEGYITAGGEVLDRRVQPASLDLRLGDVAYRLRCSFLPGKEPVEDALRDYAMGKLDLTDGAVLDRNRPYLIPLQESLSLPDGLVARANPRSSTGRLDIFTRVVTDQSPRFDDVRAGYRGKLYLEVVPRSFTVKVRTGLALSQLRLMTVGAPTISDAQVVNRHQMSPLLFHGNRALTANELNVREGLFLSLDLSGKAFHESGRMVGYRAKKNSHLLDLSAVDHYDPREFWEPVEREDKHRIVLEPEDFYLLYSRERLRIPAGLAAEMVPFDPSAGEVRTHYAGFFDPGFGAGDGRHGAHAVLEVRAHEVPFAIADGQQMCKLAFQQLTEDSDTQYGSHIGSRYNARSLVLLPRQFKQPSELQPRLWDA